MAYDVGPVPSCEAWTEFTHSTKASFLGKMEYGSGGGGTSGGGGGGDHDPSDPQRRKKRYHRHTALQIQKLES
ncbi:hypothetical protein DKX38_022028 [Salix brachista]|uniref:Uncharacterized protein n=1 Tax=Salix brachista TaxID=2182728 RepID=A0A5N5JYN7_9ROSI|nr:hypothetical protein DKX38_022028 [Salix brachista]